MSTPKLIVDGIGQWVVCHELPVAGETLIGRSSACEVQLKSLHVSGKHAKVITSADGATLEHISQSNVTSVNGKQVTGTHQLKSGDVIRIEPYTLTFRAEGMVPVDKTLGGASIEELLAARRQAAQEAEGDAPIAEEIAKATLGLKKLSETSANSEQFAREFQDAMKALDSAKRATRRATRQRDLLAISLFSETAQESYQKMLDAALRSLRAEVAFLMLINPQSNQWEVTARSKGFEDFTPAESEGSRPPISLTLVSFAVKTKKAVLTQDMPDETRDGAQSIAVHNISTGVAAPLLEGDKVIGCIYFDRRENIDELYSPGDSEDAAAFAECFSDAVQHWTARNNRLG